MTKHTQKNKVRTNIFSFELYKLTETFYFFTFSKLSEFIIKLENNLSKGWNYIFCFLWIAQIDRYYFIFSNLIEFMLKQETSVNRVRTNIYLYIDIFPISSSKLSSFILKQEQYRVYNG